MQGKRQRGAQHGFVHFGGIPQRTKIEGGQASSILSEALGRQWSCESKTTLFVENKKLNPAKAVRLDPSYLLRP
jgi:hypothetical protein